MYRGYNPRIMEVDWALKKGYNQILIGNPLQSPFIKGRGFRSPPLPKGVPKAGDFLFEGIAHPDESGLVLSPQGRGKLDKRSISTMSSQYHPSVFQPVSIGPMTLLNRTVMAPMASNTADENGFVNQQGLDYYEARARGGVGLIIMEVNCIKSPQGKGAIRRYVIDNDRCIPGLTKLAEAIHKHGTRCVAQLGHSGAESICRSINGETPVAPSALPGGEARALTVAGIHELAQLWAQAAVRAKKAGWDGVEVHGASSILLAEFQSSYWNRRTDEYGGDIRNRGRFLIEVLQAIKSAVGTGFAFWPRINVREFGGKAGITEAEGKILAQMVEAAGACAVNATSTGGGLYGHVPPMGVPKGNMLAISEVIKKVVKIPVLVTGRLDPAQGDKAIKEGKADLICMARALLADPELPRKYAEGRPGDVTPCIACRYCNDSIRTMSSIKCTVNPALSSEKDMAVTPASKPKNVLVIGGGPGGMEAAKIAALRGHTVTLYEKEKKLGGQLNLAVIPPFKQPLEELLQHLTGQMQKLGVKVELGKKASLSLVKKLKPDAVVIASGAEPFLPPIPVRDSKPVVQAIDVLAGKAKVGDRVVIIGGELVGCETAEYLAEKGIKVTVVRRGPDMATKMQSAARTFLLEHLKNKGVTLLPGVTSYDEINKEGLALIRNGRKQVIPVDTIVIAAGSKSDTRLLDSIKKEIPDTTAIGDLVEPRDIRSAVHEGYRAGLKI